MLQKKIQSFRYAWKGVRLAWREEFNFRVHVTVACLAAILGMYLRIDAREWLWVIVAAGLVLSAEVMNTALEELCDMLRPTHDPHVEKIKDLAAGAVLIAAIAAALIGLIIFIPHLL